MNDSIDFLIMVLYAMAIMVFSVYLEWHYGIFGL
jgi:hypothetical protein